MKRIFLEINRDKMFHFAGNCCCVVLPWANLFYSSVQWKWHTVHQGITLCKCIFSSNQNDLHFNKTLWNFVFTIYRIGRPSAGGLHFPEYVVYRGEQVRIFITFRCYMNCVRWCQWCVCLCFVFRLTQSTWSPIKLWNLRTRLVGTRSPRDDGM